MNSFFKTNKVATKLVAIIVIVSFLSQSVAWAQPEYSHLAANSFAKKEAIRREFYTSFFHRRIIIAEDLEDKELLDSYSTHALLVSPGKILVAEETAQDKLTLLRAIIHEEIEALMQIVYEDEDSRYQGIKETVLNNIHETNGSNKSIFDAYNSLLPPDRRYEEIPKDEILQLIFLSDIIAKAFELIILKEKKLVSEDELSPQEKDFRKAIRPIICGVNKTNYFWNDFWDPVIRGDKIRKAIARGQRFYQVADTGQTRREFERTMIVAGVTVVVATVPACRTLGTSPADRPVRERRRDAFSRGGALRSAERVIEYIFDKYISSKGIETLGSGQRLGAVKDAADIRWSSLSWSWNVGIWASVQWSKQLGSQEEGIDLSDNYKNIIFRFAISGEQGSNFTFSLTDNEGKRVEIPIREGEEIKTARKDGRFTEQYVFIHIKDLIEKSPEFNWGNVTTITASTKSQKGNVVISEAGFYDVERLREDGVMLGVFQDNEFSPIRDWYGVKPMVVSSFVDIIEDPQTQREKWKKLKRQMPMSTIEFWTMFGHKGWEQIEEEKQKFIDVYGKEYYERIIRYQSVPTPEALGKKSPNDILRAIAEGEFDALLRKRAKAVKKYGEPVLERFLHEFTGFWYPWSTYLQIDIDNFVNAWIHIYNIYKEEKADNAMFVWSPHQKSALGYRKIEEILQRLYPYIDVIALDGYGNYDGPWRELFTGLPRRLAKYKIPMIIGEFGNTGEGVETKEEFHAAVDEYLKNTGLLCGVVYFDLAKAELGDTTVKTFRPIPAQVMGFHADDFYRRDVMRSMYFNRKLRPALRKRTSIAPLYTSIHRQHPAPSIPPEVPQAVVTVEGKASIANQPIVKGRTLKTERDGSVVLFRRNDTRRPALVVSGKPKRDGRLVSKKKDKGWLWANIEFDKSLDMSNFGAIRIKARGAKGTERLAVHATTYDQPPYSIPHQYMIPNTLSRRTQEYLVPIDLDSPVKEIGLDFGAMTMINLAVNPFGADIVIEEIRLMPKQPIGSTGTKTDDDKPRVPKAWAALGSRAYSSAILPLLFLSKIYFNNGVLGHLSLCLLMGCVAGLIFTLIIWGVERSIIRDSYKWIRSRRRALFNILGIAGISASVIIAGLTMGPAKAPTKSTPPDRKRQTPQDRKKRTVAARHVLTDVEKRFLEELERLKGELVPGAREYGRHFDVIRQYVVDGKVKFGAYNSAIAYHITKDVLRINTSRHNTILSNAIPKALKMIIIVHEADHIMRFKGIIAPDTTAEMSKYLVSKGITDELHKLDKKLYADIRSGGSPYDEFQFAMEGKIRGVPVEFLWQLRAYLSAAREANAFRAGQIGFLRKQFGVTLTRSNYKVYWPDEKSKAAFDGVFGEDGSVDMEKLKRNLFFHYIPPGFKQRALWTEYHRGTIEITELCRPSIWSCSYEIKDSARFLDWFNDSLYDRFREYFPDFKERGESKTKKGTSHEVKDVKDISASRLKAGILQDIERLKGKLVHREYGICFDTISQYVRDDKVEFGNYRHVMAYTPVEDVLKINPGGYFNEKVFPGYQKVIAIVHEANHIMRARGIIKPNTNEEIFNYLHREGILDEVLKIDKELYDNVGSGDSVYDASRVALEQNVRGVPVGFLWQLKAYHYVAAEAEAFLAAEIGFTQKEFGVTFTSSNYRNYLRNENYARVLDGVIGGGGSIDVEKLKRNLFHGYINPLLRESVLWTEHYRGTIKITRVSGTKITGYRMVDSAGYLDWLNDSLFDKFKEYFPDFKKGRESKTKTGDSRGAGVEEWIRGRSLAFIRANFSDVLGAEDLGLLEKIENDTERGNVQLALLLACGATHDRLALSMGGMVPDLGSIDIEKVPETADLYADIRRYLASLVSRSPAWLSSVRSANSIFIKPNRVDFASGNGEVTPIALVKAVIEEIREINPTARIFVGERAMSAREEAEVVRVISQPLRDLCAQMENVSFVDPDNCERQGVTADEQTFSFPKIMLESDVIINLPKLKTHHQAGWSGAMKNFMGLLPPDDMQGFHSDDGVGLEASIAFMNKALRHKKIITIMDMVEVQEEWGPHYGTPRYMGMLLLGDDPFWVDYQAIILAGHNPEDFSVIQRAKEILEKRDGEVSLCTDPEIILDRPLILSPDWGFTTYNNYDIVIHSERTSDDMFTAYLRIYQTDITDPSRGGSKRLLCRATLRGSQRSEEYCRTAEAYDLTKPEDVIFYVTYIQAIGLIERGEIPSRILDESV